MTEIKIIVRQEIRRIVTDEVYDDKGLWALNGYQEHVFECVDSENLDELMDKFESLYPAFKGYNGEIIVIE